MSVTRNVVPLPVEYDPTKPKRKAKAPRPASVTTLREWKKEAISREEKVKTVIEVMIDNELSDADLDEIYRKVLR